MSSFTYTVAATFRVTGSSVSVGSSEPSRKPPTQSSSTKLHIIVKDKDGKTLTERDV